MNAPTLKAKRLAIAAQRRYDRMGELNARAVDAVIVKAWRDLQALMATTDIPNGRFQQRLRSILYDDIMGQLIVTIRKQLEEAARLGWATGVDIHTKSITREMWVKWAKWKSGMRESELAEMMMFRWAAKAISLVIDFAELVRGEKLDEDSFLKRVQKIVFPPPTKQQAEEVLRSDRWPDRKTWPQRLQREGFSFDSIVNQVSTSMSQGKDLRQITKDIEPLVNNVRVRARRIARTESIRVAQVMQRETDKNVDDLTYGRQILSVGDERVRPEHKERHGRVYYKPGWGPPGSHDIGECPETPDAPNSVLPGNWMQGRVIAALRASYRGQAVELHTASGRSLAVTYEHRVVSANGFVAAGTVAEGDYLAAYSPNVNGPAIVQDIDQEPTRIEDVFSTLAEVRPLLHSPASGADFHGDERSMHGDVEVVSPEWELPVDFKPSSNEAISDLHFPRAEIANALGTRDGVAVVEHVSGELASTSGPATKVSGQSAGFTLHAILRRIGPAANLDSSPLKPVSEDAATQAAFVTELIERNAGLVTLDKVVKVRHFHYVGHVYDLQTDCGYMIANMANDGTGLLLSNCRCTTYVLYKGIDEIGLDHLKNQPSTIPANVRFQQSTP